MEKTGAEPARRGRGRPRKLAGPKVSASYRVDPALKAEADAIARSRNETLSDVVEQLVADYVRRHRQP